MPNFAVIKDNLVVNVIVADTLEIANEVTGLLCVDITEIRAGIGYTYTDNNFEPPYVEPIERQIPPTES
jgi:hypothetical protein